MTNLLLSLHWKQSDEHFMSSLSSDSSHIIVLCACVCKSIHFVHHIFSIYGMLLVFDTSELWLCFVCWAFTWIELLLLLMDDVDTINHLWLVILFLLLSFTSNEKNHIFAVDDKCLCVVRIEFCWIFMGSAIPWDFILNIPIDRKRKFMLYLISKRKQSTISYQTQ